MRAATTRTGWASRAALCVLFAGASLASARQGEPPYSLSKGALDARTVPVEDIGAIDAAQRRTEADARASTVPTKRFATADGVAVSIDSARAGEWRLLPDGSRLWRVRVRARGATDLRFGFARVVLPRDATFYVIGAAGYYQGPYTIADARAGTFDSPVVPGDEALIELRVPPASEASAGIALSRVGVGFRNLFKRALDTGPGTSGACNVNVVCPLGEPYPDQIRAVAYYEFVGDGDHVSYICSGTLVADVPHDLRNYFLTAAHCVSSASEAASMVVYWNYQSTQCAVLSEPAGGYFNDDEHGAALRATRADADFTLVELAATPEAAWHVYYAGWDASGTAPTGTIGIHHPSGDVKKITAGPMPRTIDNCIGTGGASHNTHWQTGPYSQGTTESGSSGSGLFVVAGDVAGRHDRLLIGTLSGGDAACSASDPAEPNGGTDCYGKLASAWNGNDASTRLRDWLDPSNGGSLITQGIDGENVGPEQGHSRHERLPLPPGAQR